MTPIASDGALSAPARVPRLPACHSCSSKKIKCDNERPSCLNCSRLAVECAVMDAVTHELIPRSYIHYLEQKQRKDHNCQPAPRSFTGETPSPASVAVDVSSNALSIGMSSTVMNRGGLSFLSLLFSNSAWRKSNAELLRQLSTKPSLAQPIRSPCALPGPDDARFLFNKYLSWSHLQSAFLLRRDVWDLHSRVYDEASRTEPIGSSDLFRTFMICAIGSVIPYSNGSHHQHPEGYYLAALQHFDSLFLTSSLSSVENLLLICRYGIYGTIGTSIWDVIRLCARLCVELELHSHDGGAESSLLEQQHKRRVFWQIYLIDRYSSTTLDRPFAIDDRDILIGMPVDADDEDLEALADPSMPAQSLDSWIGRSNASQPSEMTVFLLCVRLRKVSSRIHTEFCRLREECILPSQQHVTIGRIYITLDELVDELGTWRASAPIFANPTCLYETREWHDLLYARERLYLIRRAVDLVPRRGGILPWYFSSLLLHAALPVIEQYSTMCHAKNIITHTRNYFHMMFTAGLSVIFCITSAANIMHKDLLRSAQGLRACESTLADMANRIAETQPYVTVFAALHKDVARKMNRALKDSANASRAPTAPSSPRQFAGPDHIEQAGLSVLQAMPIQHVNGQPDLHPASDNFVPPINPGSHMPSLFQNSGQEDIGAHPSFVAPSFDHMNDSIPLVPLIHDEAISPGGSQEATRAGDNLLQWAFTDDLSLWNMDTALWGFVYGDSGVTPPSIDAPPGSSTQWDNSFSVDS